MNIFFSWVLFFFYILWHTTLFSQEEIQIKRRKYNTTQSVHTKQHNFIPRGDTISIDTIVIRYKSKRKDTAVVIKRIKGKMPVFNSAFGKIASKQASVSLMEEMIDFSIRVFDDKGKEYKVLSFLLGHRKKDEYIDDETMSVKVRYDYYSMHILQDSIPAKFKNNIKGSIKGGEQFWFEKIIVENEQGEKFEAPAMQIKIFN